MRKLDLAGQRFGRLIAVSPAGNDGRRTTWAFLCDCGVAKTIGTESVRAGRTTSCGCVRAEQTRARSLRHGGAVGRKMSREYHAWSHAKGRCFNTNDAKYPMYGARGVTMCADWTNDFAAFLRDMGACPPGGSLDRIDVNGNYEPSNCRWATTSQQANNKQQTVWVLDGARLSLKEFATARGVPYKALHAAVRYRGLSPHEAVAKLSS